MLLLRCFLHNVSYSQVLIFFGFVFFSCSNYLVIYLLVPCDVLFASSLLFLSFFRAAKGAKLWVSPCHPGRGTGGMDAATNPEIQMELI